MVRAACLSAAVLTLCFVACSQAQEPSCGCESSCTPSCESCCSAAHGFCLHKKSHGCKLFSKCHAQPCCETESCCDDACGGSKKCGKLCGHGCCRNKKYIEGIERNFNCGCNGSYNYPVPPQYTYHWPGMFKQKLMTDYHSAWRFPAIKPYVDEEAFDAYSETYSIEENNIETVSAHAPILTVKRRGEVESMSRKFENMAR